MKNAFFIGMRIWVLCILSCVVLAACGQSQTSRTPADSYTLTNGGPGLFGTLTNNPDNPKITGLNFLIDGAYVKVLPQQLSTIGILECETLIEGALEGYQLSTSLELLSASGDLLSVEADHVNGQTLVDLNIQQVTCLSIITDGSSTVAKDSATISKKNNTSIIPDDELL